MAEPTATAERREEILGELAEWMHAPAREAQRRLLEAETADDVPIDDVIARLCRDLGFEPPKPRASFHPAGPAGPAAVEPMAEGVRSAIRAPSVHAPNTS